MSTRILVIGASGQVGSSAVRSSLEAGYPTIAFLRTPSKLPSDLHNHPSIKIVKGDAADSSAILSAIKNDGSPVTCVICSAPFGDMRDNSKLYETIAYNVVDGVRTVQNEGQKKIKLWFMAGSAVLDHPEKKGQHVSTFMPMTFYPAYSRVVARLDKEYQDIDWSMNCPAMISKGDPRGPYFNSVDVLPNYHAPYWWTRHIPFGLAGNIMYNWMNQTVTFTTLGKFMVDHSGADGKLKGKRVGVLEDTKAKK